jgi:hypothetical protein
MIAELIDVMRTHLQGLIQIGTIILVMCPTPAFCIMKIARLTATTSPDSSVVITKETQANGPAEFYFVNSTTGERLGTVLSKSEGDLANVTLVSSWNTSSSKVALLVFYGVRSSKIKLFERDAKGHFVPVILRMPDPLSIYGKSDLKKLSQEHVNASENSLGPWINDKSVRLVSGIMIDRGNDMFVHLLVTFTAIIEGRVEVKDVKLAGPYSDEEAERFLDQWGKKYWEELDTETVNMEENK